MTYFDAWIAEPESVPGLLGEAGASHSGERGGWSSPMFPEGRQAFFAIRDGIRSGKYRGIQVDSLRWAALMNRAGILGFLDEVYGLPGEYEARHGRPLHHISAGVAAIRAFVAQLPEDRLFAVVTDEF